MYVTTGVGSVCPQSPYALTPHGLIVFGVCTSYTAPRTPGSLIFTTMRFYNVRWSRDHKSPRCRLVLGVHVKSFLRTYCYFYSRWSTIQLSIKLALTPRVGSRLRQLTGAADVAIRARSARFVSFACPVVPQRRTSCEWKWQQYRRFVNETQEDGTTGPESSVSFKQASTQRCTGVPDDFFVVRSCGKK